MRLRVALTFRRVSYITQTVSTVLTTLKRRLDWYFSTFLLSHTGADNRLSENEAVEEIKQLAKQLQNLYDRIPQRGPATNVIL